MYQAPVRLAAAAGIAVTDEITESAARGYAGRSGRPGISAVLISADTGCTRLGGAAGPLQAATSVTGRPPLASCGARYGRNRKAVFQSNLAGKKVPFQYIPIVYQYERAGLAKGGCRARGWRLRYEAGGKGDLPAPKGL